MFRFQERNFLKSARVNKSSSIQSTEQSQPPYAVTNRAVGARNWSEQVRWFLWPFKIWQKKRPLLLLLVTLTS